MDNLKMEPIPDYGDKYTVEEWLESVRHGCINSYDGIGYWATDTEVSNRSVWQWTGHSTHVSAHPKWATHVMWFNK